MKKAVCLLSGGLDSTTSIYVALRDGYEVVALTMDYGQLHSKEIDCARAIANELNVSHEILQFQMPWKGSALLDENVPIPKDRSDSEINSGIPVTYVPARNSLFLCFAASWAETIGAEAIYIGANALDFSGYPDCRPDFFEAFQKMIQEGTKAGAEGMTLEIKSPLLHLSKKEIVELGSELKVPFEKTWSCYVGQEKPCGQCDSCLLRAKGFEEAGVEDPIS